MIHLKQDLRSTREDPRYQAKSNHEDRNQATRKIAKKRAHSSDRTLTKSDRTLRSEAWQQQQRPDVGPDAGSKLTGRRIAASDREQRGSIAASGQLFMAPTVGTTGRVQSGRQQRPVSSRKVGFIPNGYFLSGAYK